MEEGDDEDVEVGLRGVEKEGETGMSVGWNASSGDMSIDRMKMTSCPLTPSRSISLLVLFLFPSRLLKAPEPPLPTNARLADGPGCPASEASFLATRETRPLRVATEYWSIRLRRVSSRMEGTEEEAPMGEESMRPARLDHSGRIGVESG